MIGSGGGGSSSAATVSATATAVATVASRRWVEQRLQGALCACGTCCACRACSIGRTFRALRLGMSVTMMPVNVKGMVVVVVLLLVPVMMRLHFGKLLCNLGTWAVEKTHTSQQGEESQP